MGLGEVGGAGQLQLLGPFPTCRPQCLAGLLAGSSSAPPLPPQWQPSLVVVGVLLLLLLLLNPLPQGASTPPALPLAGSMQPWMAGAGEGAQPLQPPGSPPLPGSLLLPAWLLQPQLQQPAARAAEAELLPCPAAQQQQQQPSAPPSGCPPQQQQQRQLLPLQSQSGRPAPVPWGCWRRLWGPCLPPSCPARPWQPLALALALALARPPPPCTLLPAPWGAAQLPWTLLALACWQCAAQWWGCTGGWCRG